MQGRDKIKYYKKLNLVRMKSQSKIILSNLINRSTI